MREGNPVEENALGFFALWRHADVSELLRSRNSVGRKTVTQLGPMREMYEQAQAQTMIDRRRGGGLSMLDRDPPDYGDGGLDAEGAGAICRIDGHLQQVLVAESPM